MIAREGCATRSPRSWCAVVLWKSATDLNATRNAKEWMDRNERKGTSKERRSRTNRVHSTLCKRDDKQSPLHSNPTTLHLLHKRIRLLCWQRWWTRRFWKGFRVVRIESTSVRVVEDSIKAVETLGLEWGSIERVEARSCERRSFEWESRVKTGEGARESVLIRFEEALVWIHVVVWAGEARVGKRTWRR